MVRLDKKIFKGIEDGQRAFKGPQIVQIDLTGFCNNDCIGCWVHSPLVKNPPRDKNVVLSFQKIRGLIDSLFALGTQEIFLSGAGDPFMHPEIMEIIKLIKKRGFKLNIITNMLLLDEQKARKIVDAGVDLITSSVWAGTGEGYVKTHPGKSEKDFKTIGDNLKALVRQKELKRRFLPRVKVYNVICNLNYQEIRAMVNFAFSCRVDSVEFQVMDLIPEDTSFLALSAEHICQIKEQFDSLLEHDKLYFRRELLQFNSLCGNTPELKEFPGRFLMLPEGFSIFNGRRISLSRDPEEEVYKSIICPKGEISGCTLNNFSCDEANNIFYFPFSKRQCAPHKCRRCRFNWKRQLPAKFMKITGYGSFMRRLDSADLYDNNYENDLVDKVPCYVGWTYCRVLSTGEVIPCCKGVNKPLGDINKQGFTEIWNSSSYREFRNKAKFLSKNDPYFNEISCRKSCDNVGINLQIHQQVMKKKEPPGEDEDRILPSGQPSGKLSLRVLKSRSKVIVQAVSFDRGNVNSNKHNFGQGLIIDGGYHFALAEYDIFFKSSGSYELWSKYAASDPRPVDIYFDDNLIFSGGLNCATGGWHKKYVKSFKEGVLKVDAGPHTLKIFTKKLIPHIQEFIFCPAKGRDGGREAVYETENIFSKPEALKLLKYTAGRFGFLYAAGKLLKHIGKGKFLRDYLDVMGIYQGQYAFCGPGHVQIDLTYNCNNDCIGCWCNSPLLEEKSISSRKKAETLPLGLLIELIDQLSVMGTKEIYFSGGGEPFIHPQIMEILEYAKKKKFICYVNTNFTLLDKERLKRLIDLGVDHLTVSTWAASAATYAATHPNKDENTFRRIVENLEFLNKNKKEVPYIKLYNVIFNLNYHEINDMIRLAQDTGSESVEFTLIDTIPGKTDRLLLAPDQIKYLQEEGRRISDCMDENGRIGKVVLFRFDSFLRRISSSADLRSATYDRNIIDKIPCYIGWCFARIMPNGDVNACLKAHRIPTGNLYQDAFGRIWNGQKQREFRKKTLVYEKNDPFFRLIGNDPCTKEAG
ncbi:MAG: radical SAM protein, partial [Candidatus Omnitrophota bacterium]